jgi:POT family proton-dependent oligopeptide transporter
LATAISGFIGASVASYTALPEHIKPGVQSLMLYTDVFACIGLVTLVIAFLMWLVSPYLSRFMVSKKEVVNATMDNAEYSLS